MLSMRCRANRYLYTFSYFSTVSSQAAVAIPPDRTGSGRALRNRMGSMHPAAGGSRCEKILLEEIARSSVARVP